MGIKNELVNDAVVYVKYVKPIFQESVMDSVSFFGGWDKHADTLEKFQSELAVIQRKIRGLSKNFEATNMLHECFKS